MHNYFHQVTGAISTIIALLLPGLASANFPLDGSFFVEKDCPALSSIRKQTNPGNLLLKSGQKYAVKAKNKVAATHYLVMVKGERRWVSKDCGNLSDNTTSTPGTSSNPANPNHDYLLAMSWQAAFCQTHQSKKECKSQTAGRYDATHLALHGLWPQPKDNAYCGVSTKHKSIDRRGKWHLLPALKLSDKLRSELNRVMPGAASNLQRHEWYKHGTCYSPEPETYYRDSVYLAKQLNNSAVNTLFADNIGKRISSKQIRRAFDESFGKGAGRKVNIRCSGKLIGELWINLRGRITASTPLATLIKNAPNVRKTDCESGLIDPAGF